MKNRPRITGAEQGAIAAPIFGVLTFAAPFLAKPSTDNFLAELTFLPLLLVGLPLVAYGFLSILNACVLKRKLAKPDLIAAALAILGIFAFVLLGIFAYRPAFAT